MHEMGNQFQKPLMKMVGEIVYAHKEIKDDIYAFKKEAASSLI